MYLILDAPDVAMTEAAVGVVTSVFSIYTIKAAYKAPYNFTDKFKPLLFIFCISLASILIYASNDLPLFGSQFSISQQSATIYYLKNTYQLFIISFNQLLLSTTIIISKYLFM